MNPPKKFTSQQRSEEQQAFSNEQAQSQTELEFQNVEDLLRHDARHTPVPPSIERRLQDSLGDQAPPRPSWWRRLLGR